MTRFRQNDELSAFVTTPACGNGDAIFIVDEVTKFAGVEELSLRKRLHGVSGELVHFDPLSSTFNHFPCQDVNKKLKPHFAATLPTRKPRLRRELGPGYARSTIASAFSLSVAQIAFSQTAAKTGKSFTVTFQQESRPAIRFLMPPAN